MNIVIKHNSKCLSTWHARLMNDIPSRILSSNYTMWAEFNQAYKRVETCIKYYISFRLNEVILFIHKTILRNIHDMLIAQLEIEISESHRLQGVSSSTFRFVLRTCIQHYWVCSFRGRRTTWQAACKIYTKYSLYEPSEMLFPYDRCNKQWK